MSKTRRQTARSDSAARGRRAAAASSPWLEDGYAALSARVASGVGVAPAAQEDLFLVGPWASAPHDVMQWGIAQDAGLLGYTVKEGTLRLARLRASEQLAQAYAPATAVTPALSGPGAASGRAAREVSVFMRKLDLADGRPSAPGRGVAVDDATLMAIYRQPWMDASPPRLHPRVRAAEIGRAHV